MKITAIKRQQKRQDRYSVYVDGKYSFSLSENDLLKHGLHKGQECTTGELESMQLASRTGKAYDRALNYLSVRPRSQHEIERYLRRKEYETGIIAAVISKLKKLGLIDDASFARSWIEYRQAVKPRSRLKLRQELTQKGVDREIIDQTLETVDEDTQLQNLRQLIEKKRHRYDDERKLMAYLAGQGYPYDLIKQALSEENF